MWYFKHNISWNVDLNEWNRSNLPKELLHLDPTFEGLTVQMTTEELLIPTEIGSPFSKGTSEWIKSSIVSQNLAEHACLPSLPLLQQARSHAVRNPHKVAIIDKTKNEEFTYSQLLIDVSALACTIRKLLPSGHSAAEEPRVSFLVPPGYDYVLVQWAIWAAGAVCVPMCK